jgi:hypothetical protein
VDYFPWTIVYDHDSFGIGICEIIVHIWIWSLIIEEVHKVRWKKKEVL